MYNNVHYPGKVMEVLQEGEFYKVECLEKGNNFWRTPQKPDVHTYPLEDIISILKTPKALKRGYYDLLLD